MNKNQYNYINSSFLSALEKGLALTEVKKIATRFSYAEALLDLGEKNSKIVVCNADVSKSIKTNEFKEKYPEREYNFGIAEQNMVAASAGMATTGLIPFVSTYAMFVALRALDQVRNSIHYPKLNVKIGASHSGITPGPDGVTHQAQEDLSIIRTIAGSTVIAPADHITTKKATFAVADFVGPAYLSFTRDAIPVIYTDDYPFEIGKAVTIREGHDVTIIANRDLVSHALIAAENLSKKGIEARVIDCHTLKPLDEDVVIQAAKETGAIVTAENNVIFGGLGSAVAEVLVENYPIPMKRIGVKDTFAESAPYLDLLFKYGMAHPDIEKAAMEVIKRKTEK
ncbi:MAG: transketolase family protein [Spirochaetes bacterium]|nr:transketolase family protein [Spirochaetota bacterium]